MAQAIDESRKFSVHARRLDPHHARILEETSFEAAAVAYVEDFHPAIDQDNAVSVIVRDTDNGQQHCFKIDLESGETAPCG